MKELILFLIAVALVGTSISCGTIKGVGEDLGAVGGWVTKSSDRVKDGN